MIYYAHENWIPSNKNPFTDDGGYNHKWSCFVYDEFTEYYSKIKTNSKLFTIIVSSVMDKKYERLIDFIQYESKYNRNVIIKSHFEIKSILDNLCNNKSDKNTIRKSDPRWLVHSTTLDSWKNIKKDNCLYSPNELRKNGSSIEEIGIKHYLEPKDYSDYIMLDILNGCGELVVNSRQLGYVCTNGNMSYKPGARLYFDAHQIIKDGLGERDGLHILKVKNQLPLDKYLKMVVTEEMALCKTIWTPTAYTEWSNKFFLKYIK